jgi:hypothetical protein
VLYVYVNSAGEVPGSRTTCSFRNGAVRYMACAGGGKDLAGEAPARYGLRSRAAAVPGKGASVGGRDAGGCGGNA